MYKGVRYFVPQVALRSATFFLIVAVVLLYIICTSARAYARVFLSRRTLRPHFHETQHATHTETSHSVGCACSLKLQVFAISLRSNYRGNFSVLTCTVSSGESAWRSSGEHSEVMS